MPIDASIPLQVQTPQIDLGAIIGQAYQLKQMKQQAQTQNALKAIISEPGAVDEKTGLPTVNTLAKVTKIDPAYGLKLTSEIGQTQERQAQTEHAQSETSAARAKAYRDVLSEQLGVYDEDVKSGNVAPDQAERKLKEGLHDYLWKDSSISPEQRDALWAKAETMKPAQLRALTLTAEQRAAQEEAQRKEAAKRTPYTMGGKTVFLDEGGKAYDAEGKPVALTGALERPASGFDPARVAATADNRAPTLLSDPSTGKQYWAYPGPAGGNPTYKDLDGNPYHPGGAGHVASGNVRSGLAGAIQAAQDENQRAGKGPLTADQIEQLSADYTRKSRAGLAFATGKQGDQVRSLNVSIDHLETLKEAAKALHNGDIKKLNSMKQAFEEEFGAPAPTNFKALSQIVSQEVHKGVAGVGGSAGEREDLSKNASLAASPEQLEGVISSTQKLLAGQENGLRRQYQQATGLDNFDDLLSPRAREIIGEGGSSARPGGGKPAASGGAAISHPSSKSQYDALPSGAHYSKPGDPPGTYRVKP